MTDYVFPGDQPADEAEGIAMAAAQWTELLESGALSAAEQREFDSWLASDTRHSLSLQAIERGVAPIRDLIAAGMSAGEIYQCIPDRYPAGIDHPLCMAPATRTRELAGGAAALEAEAGDTVDYVVAGGASLRLAPLTRAHASFDGVVRTIALDAGSLLVTHPAGAPGVLLVRPASGGCVRIVAGSIVKIDIQVGEACCSVAQGSCVVTMTKADFPVAAGEGATFTKGTGRVFAIDPDDAFATVEDRLVGASRPLNAVVAALSSYSRVPITYSPVLAMRPVHGEYRLSKPRAALTAIAADVDARFDDRGSEWRLDVHEPA